MAGLSSLKRFVVGKSKRRAWRFSIYLAILLGVLAWKYVPRSWDPTTRLETQHYLILSTAPLEQVEEIGRTAEVVYEAYSNLCRRLPDFQPIHPKLKLLLYKDRGEFRRVNPGLGWAEAYYRKPYCRAYYSESESNPHHWMLHEAVHQLNEEVAHLDLSKWLEEGLATYFSTSRIQDGKLALGRIDPNTYPVWWANELATAPRLEDNLANGSVIPLRTIVTGRGGPFMRTHFNLYYLHWWSLTHFIFETEPRGVTWLTLLEKGGRLGSFEEMLGPVESVQERWHEHVRRIKSAVEGNDPGFFQTGELPATTEKGP